MDPRLLPPTVTLSGTPRTSAARATLEDLVRRIGGAVRETGPRFREVTGVLIVSTRRPGARLRGEWTAAHVWWAAGLTVLAIWADGTYSIYTPRHVSYAPRASIDATNLRSNEPSLSKDSGLLQARA